MAAHTVQLDEILTGNGEEETLSTGPGESLI